MRAADAVRGRGLRASTGGLLGVMLGRTARVLVLVLLTGSVLTRSGVEPVTQSESNAAMPPSAESVNQALRGLREASTAGRYEALVVRTLPEGTDSNAWTGEYDLRRKTSHATMQARSTRGPGHRAEFLRTSTRTYLRTSEWSAQHGDTWRLWQWGDEEDEKKVQERRRPGPTWFQDLQDAGMTPHLMALLAFRVPDGTPDVRRVADGWLVTGTVPRSHALPGMALHEREPNDVALGRIIAGGLAPAQLVLGPDGRIRELRLDGAAITGATRLPETQMPADLYQRAHATTLTLRLIDTGPPVTIRPPDLDQVVLQPAGRRRGPVPLYGLLDPS
jgi:hypothetical protein